MLSPTCLFMGTVGSDHWNCDQLIRTMELRCSARLSEREQSGGAAQSALLFSGRHRIHSPTALSSSPGADTCSLGRRSRDLYLRGTSLYLKAKRVGLPSGEPGSTCCFTSSLTGRWSTHAQAPAGATLVIFCCCA